MAEALYRKYRPQVFEDVVGQEPIERTLKNAISQDKVSHAYLFTGPRGTGKTTTARLLAKALLCERGPTPEPDGTCEDCTLVAEGAHPDVYELDAASRTGVDNVREEIISRVGFAPTRGRYKVYIVDEVHMLSTAAFNALLKTLEEPPGHVVFILCTTDPQKVPETIHSRCQRFDFHRISPESMVARLGAVCMAEGVEFQGEALDLIARRAGGGLRDALTSLEQIIAFDGGKVTFEGAERVLGSVDSNDLAEIMALIGKRDIAGCFRWTAEFVETGADLAQFARDMAEHVRNLYLMALVGDDVELEVSDAARRQLAGELAWFGAERSARLLGVLGDLMAELRTASNPRLVFEVSLTRMVRPDSDLTLEGLAERVEALESGYSAVAHVVSGSSPDTSAPSSADGAASLVQGDVAAPGSAADGEVLLGQEVIQESGQVKAQQAQAQADSSSALSNPAGLQRVWQAALTDVKGRKAAHGVLFMGTKVRFDEGTDSLHVMFPAENEFAFNAVQKADVQEVLSEALAKAAGVTVSFRFEKMGGQEAPAPVAEPSEVASFQAERTSDIGGSSGGFVGDARPAAGDSLPAGNMQPASNAQPAAYDDVPYEPVPYDEVPYGDFIEPAFEPAIELSSESAFDRADAAASPSPAMENLTPSGAVEEDPAAVQALLQASFGEGVVLSEERD